MGAAASTSTSVTESSATPDAKVTGLFIYPVKSCRGIPLTNAPLTPSGTRYIPSYFIYFLKTWYLIEGPTNSRGPIQMFT